jgi:hypothetical protein
MLVQGSNEGGACETYPAPGAGAGLAETSILAAENQSVHTANMTLKGASMLALVGTLLLTVVTAADFINVVSGYLHDVIPAVAFLRSLIDLFAGICLTVFFFAFARAQPR